MNSICTDIKSDEAQKSVGTILLNARQKHKIKDLNVIAEELCIKPYLLEALEQDDFDSFASSCYATGVLKNYAALLGLDKKDIASRYEAEYAGSKECVVLSFPEAAKHGVLPIKSIAGIATLCVSIFAGVWISYDNFSIAKETGDTFVPTNLHSEVKVADPIIEVVPYVEKSITVEKSTTIAKDELRLKANQDVWVRLSEPDGTVYVEKILIKGENLIAPNDQTLNLMTNNAAALSVYVDGQSVTSLGKQGEIIENVTLKHEKLLELSMLQ